MHIFQGKTFLVTGAASGIGKALVQELDALGAILVINDINETALQAVADSLQQTPLCLAFSVASKNAWQQCKVVIDAHFSKQHANGETFSGIDGIINNAGIAHDAVHFEDISEEDFKKVMDINFYGVLFGCQTFLPELKQKPQAWLANISSIFGITAIGQLNAYCASKFAVRGLSETLRMEALANFPQVKISVVHPGGIKTPIANNAIAVDARTQSARDQDTKQFNRQLITLPEKAASTIIKGMSKGKSKILIGPDAKFMDVLARLLPVKYTNILLSQLSKKGLIHD